MSGFVVANPDGDTSASPYRNLALKTLGEQEVAKLFPDLEQVEFPAKMALNEASQEPDYVYFPEGGIVSFTMDLPQSGSVEFGVIGREGISSLSAMKREPATPVRTVVQVGGPPSYRVKTVQLRAAMEDSALLRSIVYDFVYGFMVQMAFTAVSNARHTLSARLARWLLMCNDRLDDDAIPLTHEFMAVMLGAQRTSVTSTLHILEGDGAIRSRRGVVHVVDRERLETAAGEAYHPTLKRPGVFEAQTHTRGMQF